MNLEDYNNQEPGKLMKIDDLFLNKLNLLVKKVTESFEKYEYSKAKSLIENFFWHDFCDNYLEIVKKRIYHNKTGKISAQYTLYKTLLSILKMIAPIMPFITEEIYQTYYLDTETKGSESKDFESATKSIHTSEWPESEKVKTFEEFDLFQACFGLVNSTNWCWWW